ncbi:MAG: pantoate--beta-alanine ligase [Candidatus Omnitrophota bacterium]
MKTIQSIDELRKEIKTTYKNKTIGFVPTMGYLHEGHLNLVRESKKENDVTIVSIFVNPIQFAPHEDFDAYPRDTKRDSQLLEEIRTDILFYPSSQEIYPEGYATYVEVEELSDVLCGKSRSGHFSGVATIVLKLFNMVKPDKAYFGQKDAQQAIIIKKMVNDLNLDVTIRTIPTVRDTDGLALSSRNVYLSDQERGAASYLPRALESAKAKIQEGVRSASEIKNTIRDEIAKSPLIKIDYIDVVSLNRLEKVKELDLHNTLVAVAVWIGKTRLIDNFILGEI